jgi:hypothetical protein
MNFVLIYALSGSSVVMGLCTLLVVMLAPNAGMKAAKQDAMSPIEVMVGFMVLLTIGLLYSAYPLLSLALKI